MVKALPQPKPFIFVYLNVRKNFILRKNNMKKLFYKSTFLFAFIFFCFFCTLLSQEKNYPPDSNNMFSKSLHFTNKGIEYVYSKEHGGLERLTGKSATELGCMKAKCHITSCDVCHKKEVDGKFLYSKEPVRDMKVCAPCHSVPEKDDPDVHFKKGMVCMDCHTAREMHGDGKAYNTFNEPGFFDAKCENCHASAMQTISHTVHKGKLDCAVCHTSDYYTCLNCHIDARLKEKKDNQIVLKNMYFLVNHDNKVKLANMLSYVYQNKTMITFAPAFSHAIKKDGRKCAECHDTHITKDINDGKFTLASWENGKMKTAEGVIPVIDVLKWNLVFLDKIDTIWVPLENPPEPLLNFSGYCTPLTQSQVGKLNKSVGGK